MKVEDLKILKQLSPETQTRIKFELTVNELFMYVELLNERETPKQTKTIVPHRTSLPEIKQDVMLPVVVQESEKPAEAEEMEGLFYTVKDVADIYNTSLNTVYVWIKKGLLKIHHKKGKHSYFAKFDVERIKRARGKRLKRKKSSLPPEE
jgi:hypothetical protein